MLLIITQFCLFFFFFWWNSTRQRTDNCGLFLITQELSIAEWCCLDRAWVAPFLSWTASGGYIICLVLAAILACNFCLKKIILTLLLLSSLGWPYIMILSFAMYAVLPRLIFIQSVLHRLLAMFVLITIMTFGWLCFSFSFIFSGYSKGD